MTPLPLNSVFSLHGIRAMKEPGQNCLPDLFPESLWSFSLTLIRVLSQQSSIYHIKDTAPPLAIKLGP